MAVVMKMFTKCQQDTVKF